MRKKLVCVLILQFKGSCFFQLQIFTPTFGLNVQVAVNLPHWNGLFTQRQKHVCKSQRVYPKPPNILHLLKNYPCEMGRFQKALPNVKSAYVTLQDFTPNHKQIYTDISAISVTLCNSGSLRPFGSLDPTARRAWIRSSSMQLLVIMSDPCTKFLLTPAVSQKVLLMLNRQRADPPF